MSLQDERLDLVKNMEHPILLWDVMNTLVRDPFYVEIPQFFGMSLEQLLEAKHPSAWVEFELGKIDHQEYMESFFDQNRTIDQEGFVSHVKGAYAWLPGMEELLVKLRQRRFKMHAFSNYPQWYHWIEEELELSRYLQWSFVSCNTGYRKPAIDAYQYALSMLKVPAEQCLFIDDRPANCETAQKVGMNAVVFQSADQLSKELERHGIEH